MGKLKIFDKHVASSTALELTKANIESSSTWDKPEDVIKFMEDIYNALVKEDT